MRIQQLIYLEKIAETGSMNEAAKQLYVTQPSLTQAIKELEKEYQIQLFFRAKTGMTLTNEGREFINYARAILDQVNLLDTKYKTETVRRQIFSVSGQHYAFVVHAFVELVKLLNGDEYDFTLRETSTQLVLEDVQKFRSEIGVIYLSQFNEQVISNLIEEKELEFVALFDAKPHVFVGRDNPLSQKEILHLEDLEEYPYLSYVQGDTNSYFFSEEILSTLHRKKHIQVSDRATIFNLMVGLNGYTISSGIISSELNDEKIVAIPLAVEEKMTLGYVKHKKIGLSKVGKTYLDLLKQHISLFGFEID
ncbi:TPA: LysR family transcriptional regulator [Streptococcus suis]